MLKREGIDYKQLLPAFRALRDGKSLQEALDTLGKGKEEAESEYYSEAEELEETEEEEKKDETWWGFFKESPVSEDTEEEEEEKPPHFFNLSEFYVNNLREARYKVWSMEADVKSPLNIIWFEGIIEKHLSQIILAVKNVLGNVSEEQRRVLEIAGGMVGAYNPLLKKWITSIQIKPGLPEPSKTLQENFKQFNERLFYLRFPRKLSDASARDFLQGWAIFANIVLILTHGVAHKLDVGPFPQITDYTGGLMSYGPIQRNMKLLDNKLNVKFDHFGITAFLEEKDLKKPRINRKWRRDKQTPIGLEIF